MLFHRKFLCFLVIALSRDMDQIPLVEGVVPVATETSSLIFLIFSIFSRVGLSLFGITWLRMVIS